MPLIVTEIYVFLIVLNIMAFSVTPIYVNNVLQIA